MKRYTMTTEKILGGIRINPEESKSGQWVHWLAVEELLQELKEARRALNNDYELDKTIDNPTQTQGKK